MPHSYARLSRVLRRFHHAFPLLQALLLTLASTLTPAMAYAQPSTSGPALRLTFDNVLPPMAMPLSRANSNTTSGQRRADTAPVALTLGLVEGSRPMVIIDTESAKLSGIAPDYLSIIGKSLNIEWIPRRYADLAGLRAALANNAVDAAIGLDTPELADQAVLVSPQQTDPGRQSEPPHTPGLDANTSAPSVTPAPASSAILASTPFYRTPLALIGVRGHVLAAKLAGETVVYLPGAVSAARLKALYPEATLLPFDTAYRALESVALGHASVYVGDPGALTGYDRLALFSVLEVKQVVARLYASYGIQLSPANHALLQRVDDAIDGIVPDTRGAIARRWLLPAETGAKQASLNLSPAEQAWIASNPIVRVASPESVIPLAFKNSDGNFAGIAASILDMVAARTGLAFEPVFVSQVDAMMHKVTAGEADLAVLALGTDEQEKATLFTRPFMFTTAAIVTRAGDVSIRQTSDLMHHRVALVRGQPLTRYLIDHGLPETLIDYSTDATDALDKVAAGKADATVLYFATANYFISQYYTRLLQVAGTTGPAAVPVQFAVSHREPELRSIIDKALQGIPEGNRSAIAAQWTNFTPVSLRWTPERGYIRNAAIAAGLVLLAFVIWNLRLRFRIKRRRRQQALLEQRIAFLRRLIDANPNPTYVRDADGVMTDCNQALCDTMGYPADKLLGRRVDDIPGFDAQSRAKILEAHHAIRHGQEKYFETLSLRLDGRRIEGYHWAVRLSRLATGKNGARDGEEEMGGILGGWIDLTQVKEMEQALRVAKEEAESANHAKTVFMATISHEIRTPMNVIIGVLELLTSDRPDTSQRSLERQAQLAYGSATALMTLLNDILEYSKAEVDQMQLNPTPGSLHAQVTEVIDFFSPSAQAKHLALSGSVETGVPDNVLFDAGRLRQVLNNLLSNAIKFTQTGSVTLRVRRLDGSKRPIPALPGLGPDATGQTTPAAPDAIVEISITDTGPGISPEAQAGLFQPFKQASGATYSRYGGTGMGLAICRRIVEAMGGVITLQSHEGTGTVLSVTLPLWSAAALDTFDTPDMRDTGDPRAVRPSLGVKEAGFSLRLTPGARILIVDDHEANLLLLATQLKQLGMVSHPANNAEEALEALETLSFDAVITDCNMPGMSGYELAETIVAREHGRLPILGYSADASAESRQRCVDAGMLGQMVKPLTLSGLRQHLLIPASTSAEPAHALPAHDDTTLIDRLKRIANGDRDMAVRLLDLFKQGLDDSQPALDDAIRQHDIAAVRQYAHHNKGPARMLGFDAFALACEALCTTSASQPDTDAESAVERDPFLRGQRQFRDDLDRVHAHVSALRRALLNDG